MFYHCESLILRVCMAVHAPTWQIVLIVNDLCCSFNKLPLLRALIEIKFPLLEKNLRQPWVWLIDTTSDVSVLVQYAMQRNRGQWNTTSTYLRFDYREILLNHVVTTQHHLQGICSIFYWVSLAAATKHLHEWTRKIIYKRHFYNSQKD